MDLEVEVLVESDGAVMRFACEAEADSWALTGSPEPLFTRPATPTEMVEARQVLDDADLG